MYAHKLARKIINFFGLDVVRLPNSQSKSLLGLGGMNIRTVIDCGANEGQFARQVSKVFRDASFYCFEPLDEPFEKLSSWAETQNERVHCFKIALGNEEGEMSMYRHDNHTPSSSLLPSTDYCHEIYPQTKVKSNTLVRITTLDSVLQDYLGSVEHNILLKLDVQGYEDRVLQGAERVLSVSSACLLEISLDSLYEGQADFLVLSQLLKEFGYRYAGNLHQACARDGHVVYLDALFLRGLM